MEANGMEISRFNFYTNLKTGKFKTANHSTKVNGTRQNVKKIWVFLARDFFILEAL